MAVFYIESNRGARYYGGNEFVDQIENLCRERALAAFRLGTSFIFFTDLKILKFGE